MSIRGKEWTGLAVMTLVCLLLRLPGLTIESAFGDEVATAVESRDFPPAAPNLDRVIPWTLVTNPLPHFLTAGAYEVFGESLFAARLVTMLFGVLTPIVFYLLLIPLFSRRVGWITAALMTLSPTLIFHSTYARYNMSLFLLGGASFLLLLRCLHEERYRWLPAGILLSFLAVFSHVTAVFIPVGFILTALWCFFLRGGRRARRLGVLGTVVAAFTLFLVVFWDDALWILGCIEDRFRDTDKGYSPWRLAGSLAYDEGLLHTVLAGTGLLFALRARNLTGIAVSLYFVVPLLLIGMGGLYLNVGPRYLYSVLPGFYILTALGMERCWIRLAERGRIHPWFLLVFVIASQGPLLISNYKDGGRYPTMAVTRFLLDERLMAPRTPILAESHQVYEFHSDYVLDAEELPYTLPKLLERLRDTPDAFIVVPEQRGIPQGFSGESYRLWLERNARLVCIRTTERFDFKRYTIKVYRYMGPSERPTAGDGG